MVYDIPREEGEPTDMMGKTVDTGNGTTRLEASNA